ncbi:MAG: ATP-binding cassette domain-containing protein [Clostridiales bacterium]|nr:ATP-binding cassette domain-containing protein [Clostridiales bacterium]
MVGMSEGPVLRIVGLSKRYGTGNLVLENIHLDIARAETFGVIGKSGAGKSTLARCVNFLENPTEGKIYFDGQDLSAMSKRDLYRARQSMGMIFQQFNLLMQRTSLENICFAMEIAGWKKPDTLRRARELLSLVKLSDKEGSYPAQLSGGQRQRVAIARAIALNPKVLICDEATSALDPETTRDILSLLKDINHWFHITIIVITHEMHVIESICKRVAILDGSRVAEIGEVSEIFANPQTAAARALVFPEGFPENEKRALPAGRCCRVIFDGNSSFEPIVADTVLRFKQRLNILFADTKDIGGKAFGQIILQLPEDEAINARIFAYLKERSVRVEEVKPDEC